MHTAGQISIKSYINTPEDTNDNFFVEEQTTFTKEELKDKF